MDSQDVNAANILLALMNSSNNRVHDSKCSSTCTCNRTNSEDYSSNLSNQNRDSNNTDRSRINESHSQAYSLESDVTRVKKSRKRKLQNDDQSTNAINDYLANYDYSCSDWQSIKNQQEMQNQIYPDFLSQPIEYRLSHRLRNKQQKMNYQQVDRQNTMENEPIDYSDVDNSSDKIEKSIFSESDFNFYYSEQNLYRSDNEKYFDNKTKYRIFVVRYENDLRVFKPTCILKGTNTLLCSIIGTYCVDCYGLDSNLRLPTDFIWPINANRHDENVRTIRKLIQDNPVDDKLPYVEDENDIEPYSQNKPNNRENCIDNVESKIAKHSDAINSQINSTKATGSDLRRSSKNLCAKNNGRRKSKKSKNSRNVKPAHCPYCFQAFSTTSASKMHYNGRPTANNERGHISCKVASKMQELKNLEPILCSENCAICSQI